MSWLLVAGVLPLAIAPALVHPGRSARELVLLAGLALVAGHRLVTARRTRLAPRFAALLVLPVAAGLWGVLAAPASQRPAVGFALVLGMLPWVYGLIAAGAGADEAERIERSVFAGAAVGLGVVALIGVLQTWAGLAWLPQARPPAGTFVNRNVAGQALVALVPLAAAVAAGAGRRGLRTAAGLAAAAGVVFLAATRSRGAWIAVLVAWTLAAAVLVLRSRGRARRRVLAMAGGVAALAIVAALIPVRGAVELPSARRALALLAQPGSGSQAVRAALAANTAALVADHPWTGAGPGRFAAVYPLYQREVRPTPDFGLDRRPDHAHLDALELAAHYGAPAAASLLVLLGWGALLALRRAWEAPGPVAAARAAAAFAAMAGVLVHGLVSFPLQSPASAWLVFVLAGCSFGQRAGAASAPARRGLETWLVVLLVPGLVLALVDLRHQGQLARAVRLHAEGRCEAALPPARAAAGSSLRREVGGLGAMIVFECDRRPAPSLDALEPALARDPHNLNLLLATGARRLKAGRAGGAEAAFRHALEIEPGLGRAWLGVAMSAQARGRPGEVEAACRRARETAPALREVQLFCGSTGPPR
jgi:O-antigen ligase